MTCKKTIIYLFFFLFLLAPITYANIDDEYEEFDLNIFQQETLYTSAKLDTIPEINSKSAIILDRTTKSILYGKNENNIRKMASTTKIMTALVVIENSNLYDTVTISKHAANTGGSTLGIKEGDKITVCDLLYGLLLKSGNDTAVALAEYVSGNTENFAKLMNAKAKELNLENTHFVTPHGLDNDNHYTTAYELAILTDYALNNQTFSNFVGTKSYTVTINDYPKTINNTNELLGNLDGIYGVKTGFTNGANRCLVTACKRNNLDIICVVLGADTKKFRTQDSIRLIEYTYNTYQMIDVNQIVEENFNNWKKNNLSKIKIDKASLYNNFDLYLKNFNLSYYPVKKQNINSISTEIQCNYNLQAPLSSDTCIGKFEIHFDENTVLNFDIANTIQINKKNCFIYLQDFISNYYKYLTIDF